MSFARASSLLRTPATSSFSKAQNFSHFKPQTFSSARLSRPQNFKSQFRKYSTESSSSSSSSSSEPPKKFPYRYVVATSLGMIGLSLWYWKEHMFSGARADRAWEKEQGIAPRHTTPLKGKYDNPKDVDWQEVYNAIAALLEDPTYDDGSYAPVLVRLAWHASGTYSKEDGTGGSNGATMRFETGPESRHGANNGLKFARDRLLTVKSRMGDGVSYGDLWTLAGVCAIQESGGPSIPWRPGRQDADESKCTPDGRLPDASQGAKHIRDIFYRMGFNDQEIVALSGAHAMGRCHTDRSGFDGPWSFSPITFSNEYYRLLLEDKWQFRAWEGPKQFENKSTKTLMMLPTDVSLIEDKKFRAWVQKYAKDENLFFDDFTKAFGKLIELGVPEQNWLSPPRTFKTLSEQGLN